MIEFPCMIHEKGESESLENMRSMGFEVAFRIPRGSATERHRGKQTCYSNDSNSDSNLRTMPLQDIVCNCKARTCSSRPYIEAGKRVTSPSPHRGPISQKGITQVTNRNEARQSKHTTRFAQQAPPPYKTVPRKPPSTLQWRSIYKAGCRLHHSRPFPVPSSASTVSSSV